MSTKYTKKKWTTTDVILTVFCFIICVITVYPMYYVLISSISAPDQAIQGNVFLYPRGLYFGSYEIILKDARMWRAMLNTIFYVVMGTVITLFTSVTAAYPLTRPGLKFRRIYVFYLLLPMYFSGGLIPTFLVVNGLGLYNTVWSVILPSVSIMYIILVRSYFVSIPSSLTESAFIDGANHLQVLTKIIIPLSKPILAVISIYTIVGIWNSWFTASIYLTKEELHPLQMFLQRVLIAQSVDLTTVATIDEMHDAMKKMLTASQLKYSMIIFISLPIIMVYPMFQKYFIKGVMLGSLKE